MLAMQIAQISGIGEQKLTLIPSNLDNARSGLSALRVLRDLIGPRSEKSSQLATRLIREICDGIKTFPIQVLAQMMSVT